MRYIHPQQPDPAGCHRRELQAGRRCPCSSSLAWGCALILRWDRSRRPRSPARRRGFGRDYGAHVRRVDAGTCYRCARKAEGREAAERVIRWSRQWFIVPTGTVMSGLQYQRSACHSTVLIPEPLVSSILLSIVEGSFRFPALHSQVLEAFHQFHTPHWHTLHEDWYPLRLAGCITGDAERGDRKSDR